jgi:uncharacterized protein
MPNMVEVVIDSVRVSLTNQQRIVVLRETSGERFLPIWIGPYEAEAITIALQEIEVARPQTHDLLKNILNTLNAKLVRVEVLSVRDDVFYGNLVLEVNDQLINIDARPSDALAIAVRSRVPVLVDREVIESAGIEPERDLEDGEKTVADTELLTQDNPSDEGSERLSIFEDFLQNLDIDNLPPSESEDSEEDSPQPE